jgi:adenylate kinase
MTPVQKNDRARWLQGPLVQCSVPPVERKFPWRVVLLGAPGVGKGTQATLLREYLGSCHLSTGDVFRAAGARMAETTPAMKAALEYMRRGELVSDETVWQMVMERGNCLACGGGFILDGFPRTLHQAEALASYLDSHNLPLNAVINYSLPTTEIVARLSGRRTCVKCKAVFHLASHPPQVEGTCDHCGEMLYQREDDRPISIRVRLEAYERSTAPLIAFYRETGQLVTIPAEGSPEQICENTILAIEALLPVSA